MAKLRDGLKKVLENGEWVVAMEKSNAKSGDIYYAVNTKTGEEIYKGRYTDSVEAARVISIEIANGTARHVGKYSNPTMSFARRKQYLENAETINSDDRV